MLDTPNTILWTYQRTGGTTYKSQLEIKSAIFGREGKYEGISLDDVPRVIHEENSFKMSVGYNTDWTLVYTILRYTLEHKHIVLYRQNSTDRLLSLWFAMETGGFNPKKFDEDKIEKFLKMNIIPENELISNEIMTLKKLKHVVQCLTDNDCDFKVVSYEELFNKNEGYGSRDIYEKLSGVEHFRSKVAMNKEIRDLKEYIRNARSKIIC